jgi:nicotinate-nucleotide pyrophosphorylase (carboxylating)
MDTRKTTPGLRLLEKYAVRIGGGYNHRMSLDEMMLIKDNHLRLCGGIDKIKSLHKRYCTEIEVTNLDEFKYALKLRPDIIMLDNMNIREIKKAVKIKNLQLKTYNLQVRLEASGGVTLKNIKRIASTGVDMISVGELTHSAPAVDISLEIL